MKARIYTNVAVATNKRGEHTVNLIIDRGGKRMKLSYTRAMVTAALTGAIEKSEFVVDPTFGVEVPTCIEGVPSELLIPENTWEDKEAYKAACKKLAKSFTENFKKYTLMSEEVVAAGPKAD